MKEILTHFPLADLLTGYEGEFVSEDSLLTALQVQKFPINAGCEIGQIWTNAVNQMKNFYQIKLSNRFNLNFQDVERLGDMDIDLLTGVTGWQWEGNGKIQPFFFPGRQLPPGGHLLQLLIQLWLWPTMHRPGAHLGRHGQDQPQAGGGADPSSDAGHPEQRDCPLWTEQPPADRHKPHPGSQQPSS